MRSPAARRAAEDWTVHPSAKGMRDVSRSNARLDWAGAAKGKITQQRRSAYDLGPIIGFL
jgi:hypothetical protein